MKKVLVLDIELAPMVAFLWDRKIDQFVGLEQIVEDKSVLAWSAKWLGDPPAKLIYRSTEHQRDLRDDRKILEPLLKLLDEADIVLTHNGRRFDSRQLTSRFILLGMKPPSPYKHWDTLRVAKTVGDFTSNSLEYLTHKLCTKYKKLVDRKYTGWRFWRACMERNKEAWAEMRKYNNHDVLSDEELYLKLRPWAPKSTPAVYEVNDDSRRCGTCGEDSLRLRGLYRNKTALFHRLQCQRCGIWRLGKKVLAKGAK